MDNKKVGDVMLPLEDYATINEDHTISEAMLALSEAQQGLTHDQHRHRAVLVLDQHGNVVGKLTHWAILNSLKPDILQGNDLAYLDRAGLSRDFVDRLQRRTRALPTSLNRMCRLAARVRVADAMVPAEESVAEDIPLSEGIQQMVLLHVQSLLVTKGGKVVGIVRLSDVFEEVADRIRDVDAD